MFTRIEIKSFRSCQDVVLDNVGSILALVGRNGVGKTNILKAIRNLCYFAVGGAGKHAPLEPLNICVDVCVSDTQFRYRLVTEPPSTRNRRLEVSELLLCKQNGDFQTVFQRNGEQIVWPVTNKELSISRFWSVMQMMDDSFGAFFGAPIPESLRLFFDRTSYAPLIESDDCDEKDYLSSEALEEKSTVENDRELTGLIVVDLINLKKYRLDDLLAVESILGPNGLALIEELVVDQFEPPDRKDHPPDARTLHFVRFKLPGYGNRLFSFSQLSHGTRRIIRLIVQLVASNNSVLLLEHPEDGIHRGLLAKLMGIIRANVDPLQVFLTSHSPFVLNTLSPQDVRLVYTENGATRVRALTAVELAAATTHLENEGTLSEFIELVEGAME